MMGADVPLTGTGGKGVCSLELERLAGRGWIISAGEALSLSPSAPCNSDAGGGGGGICFCCCDLGRRGVGETIFACRAGGEEGRASDLPAPLPFPGCLGLATGAAADAPAAGADALMRGVTGGLPAGTDFFESFLKPNPFADLN